MADDREVYRTWAAQIKQSGGVVTVFPVGGSKGAAAARYPRALIEKYQAERRLGSPGHWTNDRAWGYYLAPSSIVKAAEVLPEATKAEISMARGALSTGGLFGALGEDLARTAKKALIIGGLAFIGLQLIPPIIGEVVRARRGY